MAITLGAERVRLDFNPSSKSEVDDIKRQCADLIDRCDQFKKSGEQARCAAIAQTYFEEAAMWAVKAITWRA